MCHKKRQRCYEGSRYRKTGLHVGDINQNCMKSAKSWCWLSYILCNLKPLIQGTILQWSNFKFNSWVFFFFKVHVCIHLKWMVYNAHCTFFHYNQIIQVHSPAIHFNDFSILRNKISLVKSYIFGKLIISVTQWTYVLFSESYCYATSDTCTTRWALVMA